MASLFSGNKGDKVLVGFTFVRVEPPMGPPFIAVFPTCINGSVFHTDTKQIRESIRRQFGERAQMQEWSMEQAISAINCNQMQVTFVNNFI